MKVKKELWLHVEEVLLPRRTVFYNFFLNGFEVASFVKVSITFAGLQPLPANIELNIPPLLCAISKE